MNTSACILNLNVFINEYLWFVKYSTSNLSHNWRDKYRLSVDFLIQFVRVTMQYYTHVQFKEDWVRLVFIRSVVGSYFKTLALYCALDLFWEIFSGLGSHRIFVRACQKIDIPLVLYTLPPRMVYIKKNAFNENKIRTLEQF